MLSCRHASKASTTCPSMTTGFRDASVLQLPTDSSTTDLVISIRHDMKSMSFHFSPISFTPPDSGKSLNHNHGLLPGAQLAKQHTQFGRIQDDRDSSPFCRLANSLHRVLVGYFEANCVRKQCRHDVSDFGFAAIAQIFNRPEPLFDCHGLDLMEVQSPPFWEDPVFQMPR